MLRRKSKDNDDIYKSYFFPLTESMEEDLEYQAEKSDLLLYCHAQKHLINLYLAIENIQEDKSSLDSIITEDLPGDRQQTVAELLHVTGTEAKEFLEMLDRYKATCLEEIEGFLFFF